MQHICKHKNFKKCAKQITNGIKKKPCKTQDDENNISSILNANLYHRRVLFDEEIFLLCFSKYFSDMPGSAQGPKFQIRILGSSEKIWGVQKENPRASAFVSDCWEGRERRGRSSLEEEKDPIFTLAAVVELEGDGGDILILETPALFSTKRTSPLQLAHGLGPRRGPPPPPPPAPATPPPPGSTPSLLPIATRTPPGLGLTPQVTELFGE